MSRCSSECVRILYEHADGVHRIYVGDDVRISDQVVDEESAEVCRASRASSMAATKTGFRVKAIGKGRETT